MASLALNQQLSSAPLAACTRSRQPNVAHRAPQRVGAAATAVTTAAPPLLDEWEQLASLAGASCVAQVGPTPLGRGLVVPDGAPRLVAHQQLVGVPALNSLIIADDPLGLSIYSDRHQRRWQEVHGALPQELLDFLQDGAKLRTRARACVRACARLRAHCMGMPDTHARQPTHPRLRCPPYTPGAPAGEARWDVRMAAWLLWLQQHDGAVWRQYLRLLPAEQDMSCMLNYSRQEIPELQLLSLQVRVAARWLPCAWCSCDVLAPVPDARRTRHASMAGWQVLIRSSLPLLLALRSLRQSCRPTGAPTCMKSTLVRAAAACAACGSAAAWSRVCGRSAWYAAAHSQVRAASGRAGAQPSCSWCLAT